MFNGARGDIPAPCKLPAISARSRSLRPQVHSAVTSFSSWQLLLLPFAMMWWAANEHNRPHGPRNPSHFFKVKDSQWYCRICRAFATEDHLNGQRHQKRLNSLPDIAFRPEGAKLMD